MPTRKPSEARRRSDKPPTRVSPPQRKSPAPGAGGGLEFRGSNSTKRGVALLWRVPRGAAYFDIRFNAKAHSLPAPRSPSLASPIITLAIAIVARSLRSINPSWPKAPQTPPTCLRCLLAQTNDRRARATRKQLRLGALCERRRAGFARLSGWQPVGNWVASAANFPASLLPVGVTPTTSRTIVGQTIFPEF